MYVLFLYNRYKCSRAFFKLLFTSLNVSTYGCHFLIMVNVLRCDFYWRLTSNDCSYYLILGAQWFLCAIHLASCYYE